MIRTFDKLKPHELDACRAALAALIGAEEAASGAWTARYAFDDNGPCIAMRVPAVPRSKLPHPDAPWALSFESGASEPMESRKSSEGMKSVVGAITFVEAIAFLKESPEVVVEMQRREELWDAAVKRAAEKHSTTTEADRAQRQRQKEYRAARPERWRALPRERQELFVAALESEGISVSRGMLVLADVKARPDSSFENPPHTWEPEHL